jgi:hypothetical protein
MFGSSGGFAAAVKRPATAPSAAASPQPSASIQPTRIPTRRLAVGFSAEARSASPSFVNWKSAQSAATSTTATMRIPTSCFEIATPPRSHALVGNGRSGGNERTSAFQIQFERPPSRMKRPIVRITAVITGPPSTRRTIVRSSAIPPANAIRSVSANATQ